MHVVTRPRGDVKQAEDLADFAATQDHTQFVVYASKSTNTLAPAQSTTHSPRVAKDFRAHTDLSSVRRRGKAALKVERIGGLVNGRDADHLIGDTHIAAEVSVSGCCGYAHSTHTVY